MYSYEDRIRAVKLYIKLGKRTGASIRSYLKHVYLLATRQNIAARIR